MKRIGVLVEVLLSQLVYQPDGALGGNLHNSAAYHRYAPGVARVYHVDRHARIAAHVLLLLATLDGVDQYVITIRLDPHLGNLRRAVRHKGGELAIGWLLQQLPKSWGYS